VCAGLVLAPSGSGWPTRPPARGAVWIIPLAALAGLATGDGDGPEIAEIVGAEVASVAGVPCTCCTETRAQPRPPRPLGLPVAGRPATNGEWPGMLAAAGELAADDLAAEELAAGVIRAQACAAACSAAVPT